MGFLHPYSYEYQQIKTSKGKLEMYEQKSSDKSPKHRNKPREKSAEEKRMDMEDLQLLNEKYIHSHEVRPDYLYHYRSLTPGIEELISGKMLLNSPNTFNDPFDCLYDIKSDYIEMYDSLSKDVEG